MKTKRLSFFYFSFPYLFQSCIFMYLTFTRSYSIQALTALIFILSLMLTAQNKHPLAKGEISCYDINLLYSRIHLKWISLCYCAKSWRQNTFRVLHWKCSSHFMFLILFSNRMLHPFIFSICFSDRISLSFPVYKLLFLI